MEFFTARLDGDFILRSCSVGLAITEDTDSEAATTITTLIRTRSRRNDSVTPGEAREEYLLRAGTEVSMPADSEEASMATEVSTGEDLVVLEGFTAADLQAVGNSLI